MITALTLRRVVGILGIAFPFVLVSGNVLSGAHRIQSSISAYYHTDMRDVFVGLLCAIGVFLLCYRGYEIRDRVAALVAGAGSIGTALVPTALSAEPTGTEKYLGIVHWAFAAAFLLSLTYMSLVLFRMTGGEPTPQKLRRNRVYLICGSTMAACLALLLIYSVLPAEARNRLAVLDPVFWLESIAVVCFGFSWLTKGEALFKDVT
ncbi:MAG TPA: hypothetical protein VFB20_11150 [Burkholderiales bacterium]|nr:hypothetical protein [Burkholderiales bacterium]